MELEVELNFKIEDATIRKIVTDCIDKMISGKIQGTSNFLSVLKQNLGDMYSLPAANEMLDIDLLSGLETISKQKEKTTLILIAGSDIENSISEFMELIVSLGGRPLLSKAIGDEHITKYKLLKSGLKTTTIERFNDDIDDIDDRESFITRYPKILAKHPAAMICDSNILGKWHRNDGAQWIEDDDGEVKLLRIQPPDRFEIRKNVDNEYIVDYQITYSCIYGASHSTYNGSANCIVENDTITLLHVNEGLAPKLLDSNNMTVQSHNNTLILESRSGLNIDRMEYRRIDDKGWEESQLLLVT